MMKTWHALIKDEMKRRGETFGQLVGCTLSEEQLHEEFDAGYGEEKGANFTAWTANRVYFPVGYDGAEWCGSAPRNPSGEATEHQGGG